MTDLQKVSEWMIDKGYATGHGTSVADLLQELEWQVAEREREACAKVVEADGLARGNEGLVLIKAAGRIRARGIDGAKVAEVGIWGEK